MKTTATSVYVKALTATASLAAFASLAAWVKGF